MNKEEYIETLFDTIYDKYRVYLMSEGEIPILVTLSPYMYDTIVNYFNFDGLTTIFGMHIMVSSEVTDFNKIGVYRIERPDQWKSTI